MLSMMFEQPTDQKPLAHVTMFAAHAPSHELRNSAPSIAQALRASFLCLAFQRRNWAALARETETQMLPLPLYTDLAALHADAATCRACRRCESRAQVVQGHGNPQARIVVIGEAPSATDDRTGLPYTGPAGQLLHELLREAGIDPDDVWITNVVRCFAGREREGGGVDNRTPTQREMDACAIWLRGELGLIAPRVVVTLGMTAAQAVLNLPPPLGQARGRLVRGAGGITGIATIQPAYLMRVARHDTDDERVRRARALIVGDLVQARLASESASGTV